MSLAGTLRKSPSYRSRLVDRFAELQRAPAPSIVPSVNAMNPGVADDAAGHAESELA